jgi:subtilisin family serine protease
VLWTTRSAAAGLNPGDVLLLEAQTTFNGFAMAPVEVEPAVFTAIRAASDAGIIGVEAAGNGAIDLDNYRDLSGNAILNRGSSHFQDSGAIMVGAVSASAPHGRLSFSNDGSRIDCYGWGESIDTTSIGGTSGASPIVAGSPC